MNDLSTLGFTQAYINKHFSTDVLKQQFFTHFQKLQAKGFTAEDLKAGIKAYSSRKSSISILPGLIALTENLDKLIALGIPLPLQWSKILGNVGTARAIAVLFANLDALKALNFGRPEDLVVLLSAKGASETIKTLVEESAGLSSLGINKTEDQMAIARYNGASHPIKSLIENAPQLAALGISRPKDLLNMARRDGGGCTIDALVEHAPALANLGIKRPSDLLAICSCRGAAQTIEFLASHGKNLKDAYSFTAKELIKLVNVDSGASLTLEFLRDNSARFRTSGVGKEQILEIVHHKTTHKARVSQWLGYLRNAPSVESVVPSSTTVATATSLTTAALSLTNQVNLATQPVTLSGYKHSSTLFAPITSDLSSFQIADTRSAPDPKRRKLASVTSSVLKTSTNLLNTSNTGIEKEVIALLNEHFKANQEYDDSDLSQNNLCDLSNTGFEQTDFEEDNNSDFTALVEQSTTLRSDPSYGRTSRAGLPITFLGRSGPISQSCDDDFEPFSDLTGP